MVEPENKENKIDSSLEEVPIDLPTETEEVPPDFPPIDDEKGQIIEKNEFNNIPESIKTRNEEKTIEEKAADSDESNLYKKQDQLKKSEETIEIREIQISSTGLKELDSIFKRGLPKICNMLFVGMMSTGKTLAALQWILVAAKKGEKALYLSLHDSEEKIINILKSIDKDVLNYINSGNIGIKKLDTFKTAMKCHILKETLEKNPEEEFNCDSFFEFINEYSPSLIVVDSLSALELSFSDDINCYRHYIDAMFKYFEKKGVRAVFIKELIKEEDLHKEFFENILADCIIYFSLAKNNRTQMKLIKEYPIPSTNEKKGILSFSKK